MTLLTLSTLPFSATGDWSELSRGRPALSRVFLLLVLPLALTCRALYRGILGTTHTSEPVTAAWMTQVAIGGALIPWALLAAVVMTK